MCCQCLPVKTLFLKENILFIDGIAADSTVCFAASIGRLQNDSEYFKSDDYEIRETVKHHCTPPKLDIVPEKLPSQ